MLGDQLELFDAINSYEDSMIKNYVLKKFYYLCVIDAALKAGKDDELIL